MTNSGISGPRPDEAEPTVLVVEDDALVRDAIANLLRSAGFKSVVYGSAQDFLGCPLPETICCLVTDVRLPRSSGFDLRAELARRGMNIPTIFITGHGDIPMSVKAMKTGAIDFLPKPFRDQDLLDAVTTALSADRARRDAAAGKAEIHNRFDALTLREKEVMVLVASGLLNKQVAGKLGLSEITVKLHRASLMRKMEVRTLADLVRKAEALERSRAQP